MDYRMPLYIQLQDIIIKKIDEKEYLPGEMIPSERRMAETYGVNRMTVKRAVSKLVEQGYLISKPGAGTFVAGRNNKKIDLSYIDENKNAGVSATMKQYGLNISNKIIGLGELNNSRFLNFNLCLDEGETVWGIHRVRLGNDEPLAVEYTYVPKKYFDDIDSFDFEKISLYDYMESKGHLPVHFIEKLIVCDANKKLADLLNVEKGTAIFKIEYQGADEDYNIVEYTKSYMNPSKADFRVKSKI